MRTQTVSALICSVGLVGCSFFSTPSQSAIDHAHVIYPKCRSSPEEAISPLFSAANIDSVTPAYMNLSGGPNGGERRIKGVRIVVRPAPGWSPESLTRSLECHEARVALGVLPARPNEPYAIPEHWVSVDVESDGDAFAIVMHTADFDDAQLLAARGRSFYGSPAP